MERLQMLRINESEIDFRKLGADGNKSSVSKLMEWRKIAQKLLIKMTLDTQGSVACS